MHYATLPILNLLYEHSYLVLFPLVVAEGPIATVISGFLVSVDFMSFIPTYLTVVLGDLVGDLLYYLAGRYLLKSNIYKLFGWIGISEQRIKASEKSMKEHRGKILFFGKLYHAIGAPILVAAGAIKIPIKDFLWYNFLATLPKSLIFLLVGYFFGHALNQLNRYLGWTAVGMALLASLSLIIYWFLHKKSKRNDI